MSNIYIYIYYSTFLFFLTHFHNFSAATQYRTADDVPTFADSTDSEQNVEDLSDMDYQQPRPGCSHRQDTVTLTFPRRVMECVDICSMADRLGLSDNQVTAIVSATLKAGGADLDKFVISASTTRRNRMLMRYHISQEYMTAFSEDPPQYAALHWDGKMLKDVLWTWDHVRDYGCACLRSTYIS